MKTRSLVALLLIIVIIGGAAGYVYNQVKEHEWLTLGLDLEGGVYVLLEAEPEAGQEVTTDTLERAKAIILNRVDELGTREPEITIEGSNRIRVSIPGAQDQEQVLDLIGKTALLEFKEIKVVDDQITYETFLTGSSLKEAKVKFDEYSQPYVAIELDSEGGEKMEAFTSEHLEEYMVITLDDEPISTPLINGVVGAEGAITGNFTDEAAMDLALLLRSGALPVALTARETRAIGPKLGQDSLQKSLQAGVIGLILVLLFMIIFYRNFGLTADIALVAYITIVIGGLALFKATLTLPGIAGLILGIGMAVDANIIIFERIKDELSNGRGLGSAIDAGFSRAIVTILDANVTTLIAAGVLYRFGTGPVRGFAVTLTLSIVSSMITAVFITRWLLHLMVSAKLIKSGKSLGRL